MQDTTTDIISSAFNDILLLSLLHRRRSPASSMRSTLNETTIYQSSQEFGYQSGRALRLKLQISQKSPRGPQFSVYTPNSPNTRVDSANVIRHGLSGTKHDQGTDPRVTRASSSLRWKDLVTDTRPIPMLKLVLSACAIIQWCCGIPRSVH